MPSACMFCMENPCTCADRTGRRGCKSSPSSTPVGVSAPPTLFNSSRAIEDVKLPTFDEPKNTVSEALAPTVLETEQDLELAASLRALRDADMLDEDTLNQYGYMIAGEPTLQEKVIAWKRVLAWRKDQNGTS